MEVWIVSTTVNVKIAQFFLQLQRGADHLCPVQPDQHGWMYSRRGDISKKWFLLMWKNDIWDINSTQMSHCQAYTHTDGRALFASGSPFPDFQGFGKVWEDFICYFLSIGNTSFVNIFGDNQFLADLQAGPGQQCVHLPWCQLGGHCCRSRYFAYSADLTWVDNFDSVDHFPPPGIHHISDGVFLSAAEALADMVSEEDLAVGR